MPLPCFITMTVRIEGTLNCSIMNSWFCLCALFIAKRTVSVISYYSWFLSQGKGWKMEVDRKTPTWRAKWNKYNGVLPLGLCGWNFHSHNLFEVENDLRLTSSPIYLVRFALFHNTTLPRTFPNNLFRPIKLYNYHFSALIPFRLFNPS